VFTTADEKRLVVFSLLKKDAVYFQCELIAVVAKYMKNYIIVGCPFTQMNGLTKSLHNYGADDIVVNAEVISGIDYENIIMSDGEFIPIELCSSAFLRYPYDLMPPFTESYLKREETEFFKSLCLLFDDKNFNPVANTWRLRNRLFSLSELKKEGCPVPASLVGENSEFIYGSLKQKELAVKSLGNCYVDNVASTEYSQEYFVSEEEDNGDKAIIFPTSKLNLYHANQYKEVAGLVYGQEIVDNSKEYRCYLIDEELYHYTREVSSSFDKSGCAYLPPSGNVDKDIINGVRNLMRKYSMRYLCFDVIEMPDETQMLIDLNPYGALPAYDRYSEPTDSIARKLIN